MKKISLIILLVMVVIFIPNVYAESNMELCPNGPDEADCNFISSSSYQAKGETYNYAVVWNPILINISGTVTYEHLEFADGAYMTVSGSGKLKFKDYGLSMTNIASASSFDESLLRTYVKGNYTYEISGDYVVLTIKSATTTAASTNATTTSKVTTVASDETTTTSEVVTTEIAEETVETTTTAEVEETSTTKKSKTKNIVILVGSIAIIGGCGAGIYFINKKIENM